MPFTFYRSITIDHTKVPNTDQTDFPVLVSFTQATFKSAANGGHVQSANGYDICFFSDLALTTPLYWEMEKYVATTGEVVAWVKIPSLSHSTNTVIYVGYGDSSISTFQSTAASVWDANYVGVYHFPDGTTLGVADSTGTASPTNSSATATTGIADGGISFGGSAYVDCGNPTALRITGSITIEAWLNLASYPSGSYPRIVSKYDGSSGYELLVGNQSDGTVSQRVYLQCINSGSVKTAVPSSGQTAGTGVWRHHVGTYSSGSGVGTIYRDSVSVGTFTQSGAIGSSSANVNLGRTPASGGSQYLTGTVDEVRISNVARSSDWIATTYNTISDPASFFTLGTETTATPTLLPSGIASQEAFGTATIYQQGTIYPLGIASDEAFGTASMAQSITISPSGIASQEAFGTAILVDPSAAQTLYPSGIPSQEAFGTSVLVQGGTQTLICTGIPSDEAFGFPTLLLPYGDWVGPQAKINGTWVPIQAATLNIDYKLNTRGSAGFTVRYYPGICGESPATFTPVVGQYVEVYEDQRKEFAGWIESLTRKVIPQSPEISEWVIQCIDFWNLLDRRVITQTWSAGTSVTQIFRDILASGLSGESVTMSGVSTSATIPSDVSVKDKTLTEVINQIRDLIGIQVWISPLRDVTAAIAGQGTAAPVAWTNDSHYFENLSIETTMAGFATSVIVRSDQNLG